MPIYKRKTNNHKLLKKLARFSGYVRLIKRKETVNEIEKFILVQKFKEIGINRYYSYTHD